MVPRSLPALLGSLLFAISASAQTVTEFRIFRLFATNQNAADTVNVPVAPYDPTRFYTEILGSSLGSFSTLTMTPAAGGTTPQSITVTPNGLRATKLALPGDEATRDGLYPLGTYGLTLNSTTVNMDLVAGATPNSPVIQGGSWISERLQVSDAGFTFNFNTPVDATDVRLYIYQQSGAFDSFTYSAGGTATSFFVPASALALGVNYGAALDFLNVVNTATGFGGAAGSIGYMAHTEFQFTVVASAIPEPSTYAVLAGAAALGLVVWRRRSRTQPV